jgi:hypothetical protein
VSEIDATNLKVTGPYPVGEQPVALTVGGGAVLVANASDNTVSRVVSGDGETQKDSGRPSAIAFAFWSLWVANTGRRHRDDDRRATGSATTARVGNGPVALASAGALHVGGERS